MSIGGGVNLIRETHNGRNFEYASEDPILSGVMVGELASTFHHMMDPPHQRFVTLRILSTIFR